MKLFGITIGKPASGKQHAQSSMNLQKSIRKPIQAITKHQGSIIIVVVIAVISITTLRMLQLIDPPIDEARASENIGKVKRVQIDQKAVEEIKKLDDSQATASPAINNNRTNPFNE